MKLLSYLIFFMSLSCFGQSTLFNYRIDAGAFQDRNNTLFTKTHTAGTITGTGTEMGLWFATDSVNNKIQISSVGNVALNFKLGWSFSAEVKFTQIPRGKFLSKTTTFDFDFDKEGKLDLGVANFPTQAVTARPGSSYNYTPVGQEVANGTTPIPLDEWVQIRVTYSATAGVFKTYINGVEDIFRTRYFGPAVSMQATNQPFYFLSGNKNFKVRNLSGSVGEPTDIPNCRVWVQTIGPLDSLLITFDSFSSLVKFPLKVKLQYELYTGAVQTPIEYVLNTCTVHRKMLKLPSNPGKGARNAITVSLTKDYGKVYFKRHAFSNPTQTPASKVTYNSDNMIVRNDTVIFPLIMYHVRYNDIWRMPSIGINTVQSNHSNDNMGEDPNATTKKMLDSCTKYKVNALVVANTEAGKTTYFKYKAHKRNIGFMGKDEPSGPDLEERCFDDLYATKVSIKDTTNLYAINQNNANAFVSCSVGCDWLFCDPYPNVNKIPLRIVADHVKAARYAVGDKKPVTPILNYFDEPGLNGIPTLKELRAMAWIAVANRANGIGFFEFDFRSVGNMGRWYMVTEDSAMAHIDSVASELAYHSDKITAPLYSSQLSHSNPAVHSVIRISSGNKYLIIANDSYSVQTIIVPVPGAIATLNPLNWNGPILPKSGSTWTIALQPLQYGIYQY